MDSEGQPQADFDLDAWIDGTTGVTGLARIIQDGQALALIDRLEMELRAARKVPPGQRSLDDRGPDVIGAELDGAYAKVAAGMLFVHVQDRTEARRQGIVKRLKDAGVTDSDTVGLHLIADAIVRVETADGRVVPLPEVGFPPEKLRQIRDRCGDSALLELSRVYTEVTSQAPTVQAPLSQGSSSARSGRM